MKAELSIAMVSPEVMPFAQTGGLGDVLGSLPQALEKLGLKLSIIMPAYRAVIKGGFNLEDTGLRFKVPVSQHWEEGSLFQTRVGSNIPVYLIRADKYFDRENLYGTAEGDYPDNAERFVFFARAALEVLKLNRPAILHAHDWQSALTITFLKAQPHLYPELSSVRTVFTIHNLGYQGLFPSQDWHLLNLDRSYFSSRYLEFYNRINFLKGGITLADIISTVSPTYAEEIKTTEYGFGLDGVFRERSSSLVGILNGVDYNIWNPENDLLIPKTFTRQDLSGKKICKAYLQRNFGLTENPDIPLLGMVSRLAAQKGFDLLAEAMDNLLSRDLQFVFVGMGDSKYLNLFEEISSRYPRKMGVCFAFSEPLAHQIVAGADLFLAPSRYEPAGLTPIYALKYGTIPIVRATGGLRDTIMEFNPQRQRGNGFVFVQYDMPDLLAVVERALALFPQKEKWLVLKQNAMSADFSWEQSAREYFRLYQQLAGGRT